MRWTVCFLVVVTFFTSSQNLPQSTSDDDGDLNLDPDTPVVSSGGNKSVEPNANKVTVCSTGTVADGVCVPYYLCDQTKGTVIEDGYSIIDIRAGTDCLNFLDVCCQRPQVLTQAPASSRPLGEDSAQIPTRPPNVNASKAPTESPVLPTTGSRATGSSCGFSNPGANLFIVREGVSTDDRVYADFGEFPWMVAILRRANQREGAEWKQDNYVGGGSLIHPSAVLTVAHKVAGRNPNQIIIRAGEYDTNSEDELYPHQDINVFKIITHEKLDLSRAHNDVGLLILEKPVKLENEPHIGIGCLSPQPPTPGAVCFSMGWGRSDFRNKNVFASILKKVKLPVMENDRCERILKRTRLGQRYTLHPSLFCAGGVKDVDNCRGDGGSSIVCPINANGSRFAIYGMVAYGVGCGLDGIPAVYVNGANIYEWVGQQFKNEGLNTRSYIYT